MVSQKITVINKSGLHARPAGELAKITSKCNSDVTILVGERKVNPKSILNLMAAAIRCGTEIDVICSGETEEQDLKVITDAIAGGLGE
jgi:phosphocarrier protein HPr